MVWRTRAISVADLVAGQLAALAGLGALRDLDLQLVGAHQVLGRHAEPARRHLLGARALAVAVRQRRVPRRVLAAFAGVAPRAEPVHRHRDRLVRLLADRAERHRRRDEPRDDLLHRLDLLDRDRRRRP